MSLSVYEVTHKEVAEEAAAGQCVTLRLAQSSRSYDTDLQRGA